MSFTFKWHQRNKRAQCFEQVKENIPGRPEAELLE